MDVKNHVFVLQSKMPHFCNKKMTLVKFKVKDKVWDEFRDVSKLFCMWVTKNDHFLKKVSGGPPEWRKMITFARRWVGGPCEWWKMITFCYWRYYSRRSVFKVYSWFCMVLLIWMVSSIFVNVFAWFPYFSGYFHDFQEVLWLSRYFHGSSMLFVGCSWFSIGFDTLLTNYWSLSRNSTNIVAT